MTFFADLGTSSYVAKGPHVRAVGWLHPDHPYIKGEVPVEFLTRLKEFVSQAGESARALYFGAAGGFHSCEFCGKAHGIHNFGIPSDGLLYIAPEMIVHYIEEHGYQPPSEFVRAVFRSALPVSDEYQVETEPFWHLHRDCVRRMIEANEGTERQE